MTRRYRVTIYNQHAGCGIHAEGRSRNEAFRKALIRAGEPFLRYGGDKLTTFRTLFAENIMHPHNRTRRRVYVSHPIGAVVDCERISDGVNRAIVRPLDVVRG